VTSSQQDFEVDYFDIVTALHEQGVRNILNEMQHLNPDLFYQIEVYFRIKETDKKLGALLDANISGRQPTGISSNSVAIPGSSGDSGIK
jgi:hypothetical protein